MLHPALPRVLTLLAMLGWSASLVLPAVDMGPATAYGGQLLLHGWKGLTAPSIGGLSWLANPLLIGAWLAVATLRDARPAMLLAWSALTVALTSLSFDMLNRGRDGLVIESFAIGFYLWLASMVLQAAAATLRWHVVQRRQAHSCQRPAGAVRGDDSDRGS